MPDLTCHTCGRPTLTLTATRTGTALLLCPSCDSGHCAHCRAHPTTRTARHCTECGTLLDVRNGTLTTMEAL